MYEGQKTACNFRRVSIKRRFARCSKQFPAVFGFAGATVCAAALKFQVELLILSFEFDKLRFQLLERDSRFSQRFYNRRSGNLRTLTKQRI